MIIGKFIFKIDLEVMGRVVVRKKCLGIGFFLLNDFWIGKFLKIRIEFFVNFDEFVFVFSLLVLYYNIYWGSWVYFILVFIFF